MRFLIDFFRWLFYGGPKQEQTAASVIRQTLADENPKETAVSKPREMKVVDLRVLASPDDFLNELRAIRPGNDFVHKAKSEMVTELRRIAAMCRRGPRKDAA